MLTRTLTPNPNLAANTVPAKPAWASTLATNTVAKPAWAPTLATNTVAKPAWALTLATNTSYNYVIKSSNQNPTGAIYSN